MPIDTVKRFLRMESSSGILLMGAAGLALALSNSPWGEGYFALLDVHLSVSIGDFALDKPLLLWVNDGLMAVFFLLIGLEIKREVLEGELRSREQIVLPAFAAFGGFVLPALIYIAINRNEPLALNGWAIPAATDIAFALGVLMLLGSRVPLSLKLFLTSLAIFDDLAAIIVIAVFYSGALSLQALAVAGAATLALAVMNRAGVVRIAAYVLVGAVMWVGVLKSGVHATLAGIIVALAIPMRSPGGNSPLGDLEEALHPWVAYMILPAFAFANAGVSFAGMDASAFLGTVPLGILLGLFVGKQVGVFVMAWLAIRLGWATLPDESNWLALYGVALLTGIGFTMSLFIGTLAFQHGGFDYAAATRVGVLCGSLLSAIAGLIVLRVALAR
ncbi:MAG TPA: Na+/H+ antiporter NhaA [Gammaproteobacteria bacterium]|nr:Na+/H+ antiporter NhaA [Gammaproteobacteria bacterium]